jgi:ABC-2 type transport system permease protein
MLKNLEPLFTIIHREIDWMRSRWVYWFLTIVGPLLGFALVLGIFSQGVVRNVPVSVVDLDKCTVSRQIIRMIDATSIAKVDIECNSLAEAEELMLKGETNAIIYISEDLEKKLLKSSAPEVLLYINNANILKGGLLKSGLLKAVSTFNAGVKVQIAMKKGANTQQAISEVLPINLDTHVLFNPYTNYFYFLATVLMPVILIIFILLGSIYSFGYELKNATALAALQKANNSIVVLAVGKLLPYTILFFIQALIFNHLIFNVMGLPLTGSYSMLLLSELMLIIAYQALAVFIVGILGNLRLGVSIGSAYSMMALTFSGLTFPEVGMPLVAKIFSQLFPLSYWLKIFLGQTLRHDPLVEALPQLLYLLVFISMGAISLFWLKQKYSNEKYWSKV